LEYRTRKSTRLPGFDYNSPGVYYLTVCVKNRARLLSRIVLSKAGGSVQLLPYGQIADRIIRQMDAYYSYLTVDKYVIMPDHIHFLITITDLASANVKSNDPANTIIARFIGTFKRFCNKEYGKNIWQDGSNDHLIRNQQDYNEKWIYIDNNPIKWIVTGKAHNTEPGAEPV